MHSTFTIQAGGLMADWQCLYKKIMFLSSQKLCFLSYTLGSERKWTSAELVLTNLALFSAKQDSYFP